MGGPSDKWSKKEGGRGRVLWIEHSGVYPGSGLEHGRSAQQELQWVCEQGTPATYLFDAGPDTSLAIRTHLLLARATRGCARVLLAVCSETVASQTHGRVDR